MLELYAILTSLALVLGQMKTTLAQNPPQTAPRAEMAVVSDRPQTEFERTRRVIIDLAWEYRVNPDMAMFIAEKESRFNPRAIGDRHLTCKRTGMPIRSRGIWQINDCANPEVSDAEAFSVVSSTLWAMPRLKEKPWIWSVYKLWGNEP